MKTPIVSVVIPTFNRCAMVVRAVESVLVQTFQSFEIVVVDDGSTDDTLIALAQFGDKIKVRTKENGGVASARNLGVRATTGKIIAFLDSDDQLRPDCLAAHVRLLANPLVVVSAVNWTDQANGAGAFEGANITGGIIENPITFLCRKNGHRILPSSLAILRRTFDKIGGFDERLRWMGEDTKLILRAAFEGRFALDQTVLVDREAKRDAVKLTRTGNFEYDCLSTIAALECFSEAYYLASSRTPETRAALLSIRARLLHASAKQAARRGDSWLARRRYVEALLDGLTGRARLTALLGVMLPTLRT